MRNIGTTLGVRIWYILVPIIPTINYTVGKKIYSMRNTVTGKINELR